MSDPRFEVCQHGGWRQGCDACGADEARAALTASQAETAEVKGQLDVAWNEIHVQAKRNQRLVEDNLSGTTNLTRQLVADRTRLETDLATAAASLERARGLIAKWPCGICKGMKREQLTDPTVTQREAEFGPCRSCGETGLHPLARAFLAAPPTPIATPGTEPGKEP